MVDISGRELLLAAMRGEETPRRPVWLMRQAGRILPEYRALRADASFEEMSQSPDLATRVTLLPFDRFDFDAAIVFADLMSPVPVLGIDVRFAPGPVLDKPVASAADIDALPDPDQIDAEAIAPEVAETLRRVREQLPAEKALLGFAGAPLSLAAYLVQGQGRRGFPALRALAYADPLSFEKLLSLLSRLVAKYLIAQHQAGADAIQVFDSWGGVLAAPDWRRWVRPHLVALLEEVGRAGVPRILFVHEAPQLVDEYAQLPCEVLSVDWRTDLPALRERYPQLPLQGNLDPATLLGGAEATRQRLGELLERMPRRGHLFNLGHGLLPETPLESVAAILETIHAESRD